jgi:phosphohistidine phosphatase SixA
VAKARKPRRTQAVAAPASPVPEDAKLFLNRRLASGFNQDQLHVILHEHARANAVMLVGHEPDLSEAISKLIGGGRVAMKKGGLALVELPNAQTRRGELLWLLPPKWLAS